MDKDAAEYRELKMLIEVSLSTGEQWFLDGERTSDADSITYALLTGSSHVYSLREN